MPESKAVESVTLPLSLSLGYGLDHTFVPVILQSDATNLELTWSSNENLIMTVTSAGVIQSFKIIGFSKYKLQPHLLIL